MDTSTHTLTFLDDGRALLEALKVLQTGGLLTVAPAEALKFLKAPQTPSLCCLPTLAVENTFQRRRDAASGREELSELGDTDCVPSAAKAWSVASEKTAEGLFAQAGEGWKQHKEWLELAEVEAEKALESRLLKIEGKWAHHVRRSWNTLPEAGKKDWRIRAGVRRAPSARVRAARNKAVFKHMDGLPDDVVELIAVQVNEE
jgi:hypothetical protein